jgi:hypothetical protein
MKIVNRVAITIFILSLPSIQCEALSVELLKPGSTHYVFEELVNIRSKPSTDAAIVSRAPIGTPVTVTEDTEIWQEIYGFSARWYKVTTRGVEGYLWGGLLSSRDAAADVDGDGRQELVLDRVMEPNFDDWRSPPKHEVKLCRDGTTLTKDLIGDSLEDRGFWTMEVLSDPGFTPTVALVVFSQGFADGGAFDIWYSCFRITRDWRLEKVLTFATSGDLGYSLEEKLLLPRDLKVMNMLVVEASVRKQVGERTVTAVTKRRRFVWDGAAFTLRSEETFDVDLDAAAAGG